MSSIRGINGVSGGGNPLEKKDQFSASLEKAQKKGTTESAAKLDTATTSKNVALAGRVVHSLVNGDYGEHDIASGSFSKDVEAVVGETVDTAGLPDKAGRTKVANAFIKFLKNSDG